MKKMHRSTTALVLLAALLLTTDPVMIRAGSPISDKFVIHSSVGVDETEPSIAYNGQNREYLVVWGTEPDDTVQGVWGQRLSRSGALLGAAFQISPPDVGRYPDVAYNSLADQYLVVWETGDSDIRGRRLSSAGDWVSGEILIATGYEHGAYHYHQPSVAYASTADRYLVTFQYNGDVDGSTGIQARAYLGDGAPENYAFEVAPTSNTTLPELAELAYNRSRNEFLVIWQQTYTAGDHDIYARRVKMSGGAGALDSPMGISTSGADEIYPAVAALPTVPDEGQYLVAWESDGDIRARTLSGVGVMGSLRILAETGWGEHKPSVAGGESNRQFLVVWTWLPVVTPPAMSQVQARTLALDGSFLETTVTNIGGRLTFDPAVVSGPGGDFLIAFDEHADGATSYARDLYGYLWGGRIYLPVVIKN